MRTPGNIVTEIDFSQMLTLQGWLRSPNGMLILTDQITFEAVKMGPERVSEDRIRIYFTGEVE